MKRYLSILIASAFVVACGTDIVPERDYAPSYYLMTIRNTSDKDISVFVPDHGEVECEAVTGELPDELTPYLKNAFYEVAARSSIRVYITEDGDKSPIETYHVGDKVTFYFFDSQVLKEKTWQEIKAGGLWLRQVCLSADDLIEANQELVY